MRHIIDPLQPLLFDPYAGIFSVAARRYAMSGWAGLFRGVLLQQMPASELAKHYNPIIGRPTKELYAMAGLLFLQGVFDWTNDQTLEAFLFRSDIQFALNLAPCECDLSLRSVERYRKHFIDDDLAAKVMDNVTSSLIKELQLNIDQQRLDSTHVFSNMATFGRTRMMAVTIKRFLAQVQRHHLDDYKTLPEELRERYAAAQGKLFSQKGKSDEQRAKSLQQVAEDMHDLVNRFADHKGLNDRPSYRMLARVFNEQCEVEAEKILLKKKTGGRRVQNPSDAGATYDQHKGVGHKTQLVETCSTANEVQLIVLAKPETAVDHDSAALQPIIEELKKKELLPKEMLADTTYGSDENVQFAAKADVELVTPTPGTPKAEPETTPNADPASPAMDKLSIDDFAVDERTGKVSSCPSGRVPLTVLSENGTTTIAMSAEDCESCEFREACPIDKTKKGKFKLEYEEKQRRLEERRREEKTSAFKERYARRAGIESTNSGLKRKHGLGRLRVRGSPAVRHEIFMKVAGWNMNRAATSEKLRERVQEMLRKLGFGGCAAACLAALWAIIKLYSTYRGENSVRPTRRRQMARAGHNADYARRRFGRYVRTQPLFWYDCSHVY